MISGHKLIWPFLWSQEENKTENWRASRPTSKRDMSLIALQWLRKKHSWAFVISGTGLLFCLRWLSLSLSHIHTHSVFSVFPFWVLLDSFLKKTGGQTAQIVLQEWFSQPWS